MVELYNHSLFSLHGLVLNKLSTATILPFVSMNNSLKNIKHQRLYLYKYALLIIILSVLKAAETGVLNNVRINNTRLTESN
jgi:hypothetical protein